MCAVLFDFKKALDAVEPTSRLPVTSMSRVKFCFLVSYCGSQCLTLVLLCVCAFKFKGKTMFCFFPQLLDL